MTPKKKVLILDDDVSVAVPLQAVLEDHGFEAKATVFVSDFEKTLARENWDAAVLDVYHPTERGVRPIGLDIARQIRKYRQRFPIAIISSWTTSKAETVACADEIGAKVVWKPLGTGREVIEAISSLIEAE